MGDEPTPAARRARLARIADDVRACTACPQLAAARTTALPGAGAADADVLLVTGPPDANEDRQGLVLAGAPGRLLDELLDEAGLAREDVFVAGAVRCRPPQGRAPDARELAACRGHLDAQLETVRPRVVCPMGTIATRAVRGDRAAIRAVHGQDEVRVLAGRAVRVVPLFHPAAALYHDELVAALRADLVHVAALLEREDPEPPVDAAPVPDRLFAAATTAASDTASATDRPDDADDDVGPAQLGLF